MAEKFVNLKKQTDTQVEGSQSLNKMNPRRHTTRYITIKIVNLKIKKKKETVLKKEKNCHI